MFWKDHLKVLIVFTRLADVSSWWTFRPKDGWISTEILSWWFSGCLFGGLWVVLGGFWCIFVGCFYGFWVVFDSIVLMFWGVFLWFLGGFWWFLVVLKTMFSHKLPKVATSPQKLSQAIESCQKSPEVTKSRQKLPKVTKSCQKLPQAAKSSQQLPQAAKICQKWPQVAKSYHKFRCILVLNYQVHQDVLSAWNQICQDECLPDETSIRTKRLLAFSLVF